MQPDQAKEQAKGFFKSLFDISFSSLITTKIIKVLYVLSLIGIGVTYLVFVVGAFASNAGLGALVLLIIGPLAALFWAIVVRVSLEYVVALFRIMETNVQIVANTGGQGRSLPPGGTPPQGGTPAPAPASSTPPPPDAGDRIA